MLARTRSALAERTVGLWRGRWRRVHVVHPPKTRAPLMKLCKESTKILYVAEGWVDRLRAGGSRGAWGLNAPARLPPQLALPGRAARSKRSPSVPAAAAPARNPDVETERVVAVCFAKTLSHHLVEAFTADEVRALWERRHEIDAAFLTCPTRLAEIKNAC